MRMFLADPTGQIQRECAEPKMRQKDVVLTYALAIRDEETVPVDWPRANAAIAKRWGMGGLARVKNAAWRYFLDDAAKPDVPKPVPPCGKPCTCSRGGCWNLDPPTYDIDGTKPQGDAP
jgi:hypothetical protein